MIWFLRHGEAEDGSPDFDRKLTEKGERQSRDAGVALAALGIEFDAVLTSPRVRAHDTARLACASLGIEPTIEERLTGGDFDPLAVAAGLDNALLVGHEPDFSHAIAAVTGARVDMKKGGLAAIDGRTLCVLMRPAETHLIATVRDR